MEILTHEQAREAIRAERLMLDVELQVAQPLRLGQRVNFTGELGATMKAAARSLRRKVQEWYVVALAFVADDKATVTFVAIKRKPKTAASNEEAHRGD